MPKALVSVQCSYPNGYESDFMQVRRELEADLPLIFSDDGRLALPVVEVSGTTARRENVQALVSGLKKLDPGPHLERGLSYIKESFNRRFSHRVIVADDETQLKPLFLSLFERRATAAR